MIKISSMSAFGKPFLYKLAIVLVFVGFSLWMLLSNTAYLRILEKTSLFIPDRSTFINCFSLPAGLISYLGLFFNQSLHWPIVGTFFLTCFLFVLSFFSLKAFNLNQEYFPLAFLSSTFLLWAFLAPGYNVLYLKTPGFAFSQPLGVIGALSVFWIYKSLKNQRSEFIFTSLAALISYPLLGFYGLMGCLFCLVLQLLNRRWILALLNVIFAILVPWIYSRFVYGDMMRSMTYLQGIVWMMPEETNLWLPYALCFLCLLMLSLLYSNNRNKINNKVKLVVSSVLFFASLSLTFVYRFDDENFMAALEIEEALENSDYEKVVEIRKKMKEDPTRNVVMMTNAALYHIGRAGSLMFTLPNGNKSLPSLERPVLPLYDLGLRPYLYLMGKINSCYRWSMESLVENGLNARDLKYMVKCAILNNEIQLSKKYNSILHKSLIYRQWAQEADKDIAALESGKELVNPEFKKLKPLMTYMDILGGDGGSIESWTIATTALMRGGPMELVELSLQCNLLMKNVEGFWPRLLAYYRNHDTLPRHYQEAAILFSEVEKDVDWRRLELDSNIIHRFANFMRISRNPKINPLQKKEMLHQQFGDTYWYYFFFGQKLKTYENQID